MSRIIRIWLVCLVVLLSGCGEKPQKTLVGNVAIAVLPPVGFCESTNTADMPILIPFITPENIHRKYESCSEDKKVIAWIASHFTEHSYSNPADKFAASMAKNFEKSLKDESLIPQDANSTVEHDDLASYVMVTRNTGNQYVATRIGMTIVKGKVLTYWMLNYSDKPFETTLDFAELKQWIANAHQIN